MKSRTKNNSQKKRHQKIFRTQNFRTKKMAGSDNVSVRQHQGRIMSGSS